MYRWRTADWSRILNGSEITLAMPEAKAKPTIVIRDLEGFDDLRKVEKLEQEVWGLSERDVLPLTMAVATKAAGSIWIGAFDGSQLVGFVFGVLGVEDGRLMVHSHMLAVRDPYHHLHLGYKLKLAQRERALAMRIPVMTWTFDPLQSRNAHLNFSKLGVVSNCYKADFYGPETSSVLHRNSTDRLWVKWPMASRRVQQRLQGHDSRNEVMDALLRLVPLIRFNGDGKPVRTDLASAVARQRIAIEIPCDIGSIEGKDQALAREWRQATRWAFHEALNAGFLVAEFCRTIRGQQGPSAYLLEKIPAAEYVPELGSA